ncbi:MAG: hypothetical protein AB7H96_03035 [Vicinamibacterales bacterium]
MKERVLAVVLLAGSLVLLGTRAYAAERFALVVTGASGGPQYAEKYDEWRNSFVQLLQGPLGYPEAHVQLLAEEEFAGARKATRENVRAALADIRQRAKKDDLLLVVLVGHGSGSDATEAKFNLVGPDLTAHEWADLLAPMPTRTVVVNAASGSFPFLEALSARNRIVITANDSAAQTFETVLPQFLLAAYTDAAADLDKNGRTSVWEAFTFMSAGVRGWFEQRSQLATEHPMLDDDGDGAGRLLEDQGPDGILARTTYLKADERIEDTGNPQRTAMLRRRAELEQQLEELRARKETMPTDEYELALERIVLEIARIDRSLRSRS